MNKKDIKCIFDWARKYGDANICDRILLTIMPQFLNENIILTSQEIKDSKKIYVSNELYELILKKAEELVGVKYV